MEAIIRIALDDGGNKWITGTLLAAYPLTQELGPGEKCGFLCIKVNTSYTLQELRAMRLKKKIDIGSFVSTSSLDALRRQKEKLYQSMAKKERMVIEVSPKFYKIVDVDKILSDTPERQWPIEPEMPEGIL